MAKVRFGVLGHAAYMFAALVANFVVGSEILIGGAGVITGMTGISQYAAIWLLPLVVVAYGPYDPPGTSKYSPFTSSDRWPSSNLCVCISVSANSSAF